MSKEKEIAAMLEEVRGEVQKYIRELEDTGTTTYESYPIGDGTCCQAFTEYDDDIGWWEEIDGSIRCTIYDLERRTK